MSKTRKVESKIDSETLDMFIRSDIKSVIEEELFTV